MLLIVGASICVNLWLLLLAWMLLFLVAVRASLAKFHLKLTFAFILPLALGSVLITGMFNWAYPHIHWWEPFFAAIPATSVRITRIAVISAALHLCFVPLLNDDQLSEFLKAWKCPDRVLIVVLGSVTLMAELGLRSRQVLDARRAQGKGATTRWGAVRQLPFVLMPLTIYMLDAAANRSELWKRRNLIDRLIESRPTAIRYGSPFLRGLWLIACVGGFALAAISRLKS